MNTPRHHCIKSIEKNGATVSVIKGNYDDAVRQLSADAAKNGWQVISDTSWEGYEDIPKWVMQGYTTLLAEAQQELAAQGIDRPTHVFCSGWRRSPCSLGNRLLPESVWKRQAYHAGG